MKKAQILSAIALAFALGLTVVAPAAFADAEEAGSKPTSKTACEAADGYHWVEDADADITAEGYDEDTAGECVADTDPGDDDEEKDPTNPTTPTVTNPNGTVTQVKSTKAEVSATITAIEGNSNYIRYKALIEAANATATPLATAQSELVEAIKGLGGDLATYAPASDATLSDVIAKAEATTNFTKYVALANAISTKATTDETVLMMTRVNNVIDAIKAINPAYSYDTTKEGVTASTMLDQVVADAKNNSVIANAQAHANLVAAVAAAKNSVKVEGDLRTALKNAGKSAEEIAAETTIEGLKGLATTYPNATAYGKYVALYNAVKDAKADATTDASNDNYQIIEGLKTAYKNATGANLVGGTTTPSTPDTTTTITTPDNTVSVKGELQDGLVVKASEAEDKDEMFKKAFGDKKFFVYNIEVLDKDGNNVTTFDKNVTVTVKVPETIDGAKAGIYYVNDEGKAEKIASTYNAEAKTLTFTTNHFSFYAIVEDGGVNVGNNGVIAAADGTASSTVAIVAGIATALTAAGAGVVAYRNARRAGKEA